MVMKMIRAKIDLHFYAKKKIAQWIFARRHFIIF